MSTLPTSPSTLTATSSPSATDQGSQPPGGFGNTPALSSSAALYLYTFLATLILLITISAAIIARSYCIRRRQRQLLDEAIRNGTYVPPLTTCAPNLKEKPVLYDIFLTSEGPTSVRQLKKKMRESESSETDFGDEWKEQSSWGHLMPLAALTEKPSVLVPAEEPSPPSTPIPSRTRWIPRRLRQRPRGGDLPLVPLGSGPPSPPGTPPDSETNNASPPSETPEPESMQLALFIAMPGPTRKKFRHSYTSEEEQSLPPIEIGFTEVSVRPSEPRTDTGEAGGGPENIS